MKERKMFKSERKKHLLDKIHKLRRAGGTFSEISSSLNADEELTLIGKKWTHNYTYRFYTENINKFQSKE